MTTVTSHDSLNFPTYPIDSLPSLPPPSEPPYSMRLHATQQSERQADTRTPAQLSSRHLSVRSLVGFGGRVEGSGLGYRPTSWFATKSQKAPLYWRAVVERCGSRLPSVHDSLGSSGHPPFSVSPFPRPYRFPTSQHDTVSPHGIREAQLCKVSLTPH